MAKNCKPMDFNLFRYGVDVMVPDELKNGVEYGSPGTIDNDIAIIKANKPFFFFKEVRAVELGTETECTTGGKNQKNNSLTNRFLNKVSKHLKETF